MQRGRLGGIPFPRTFPIRGGGIWFHDRSLACRRVGAIKGPARDYDMKIAAGERIGSKEGIMYHLATTLIAGIIATVLVSGIAIVPTPAEAAKMSNAERVALEKATAACKAEAKGMKFSWHWRKRQKYVQNCIIRTVNREGFSIDIWEVRSRVNMKGLRTQQPGEWGCDPMC